MFEAELVSTGRYSQKTPSLTQRSQEPLSADSGGVGRHWDSNVSKGMMRPLKLQRRLLTLSLRKRQFVQLEAIGLPMCSLTEEGISYLCEHLIEVLVLPHGK